MSQHRMPMLSEDKSRITKIDNSVYINFDYEYKTKPNVNNTVRGIVLGKSGVGKTSFINSICGTSYLAGVSQQGLTRQIQFGKSKLNQNFILYDTPGLDCKIIRDEQKESIKNTLKNDKWNLVFIMVKLSSRFQNDNIPQLMNISKIFSNQTDRVIFLISHIDIADQDKDQQERIARQFDDCARKYKIMNKIIFLSNKNKYNVDKLTKILYEIGCEKQQRALKFNQRNYDRLIEKYHPQQSVSSEKGNNNNNNNNNLIHSRTQQKGCQYFFKNLFNKCLGKN